MTRGRLQLNLAGPEVIVAAAKQKAEAMDLKVNIAVVDDGGHLLAFARKAMSEKHHEKES